MKAIVSITMGSTSDMPVMKKAAEFLNDMEIPFEINALSAHRTPQIVENFATNARSNHNSRKKVWSNQWCDPRSWNDWRKYISHN